MRRRVSLPGKRVEVGGDSADNRMIITINIYSKNIPSERLLQQVAPKKWNFCSTDQETTTGRLVSIPASRVSEHKI
jgi:hypothetical protein